MKHIGQQGNDCRAPLAGAVARGPVRAYDLVNDILVPLCVLGALWSFTRFVLDARSALGVYDSALLRFVFFWFLVGVIGIVKIRHLYGSQAVAIPYIIGLALAVAVFLLRYSSSGGALVAARGLSPFAAVVNAAVFLLVWWGAAAMTRDCSVDEQTESEASGRGLLALGRHGARRVRPGRSVLYFSLVALLVFGLCQALLAHADSAARKSGFLSVALYLCFALLLLALTNLSGLRLYLRARGARVPKRVFGMWVLASGCTVAAILGAALVIPRTDARGEEGLLAQGLRVSWKLRERIERAPQSGLNAPERPRPGEGQQPGRGTRGDEGEKAPRASATGTPLPEAEKSGPPLLSRGTERGAGEGREARHLREEGTPQGLEQAPERARGEKLPRKAQRGTEPTAAPGEPPPLERLARLAALLLLVFATLALLWAAWRQRKTIAAGLRIFLRALAALALAPLAWLRQVLCRLSPRHLAAPARPRLKPLQNPFADDAVLERLSPREVVLHTYGALLALAERLGCPRKPSETALEFARRLPPPLAPLRREAEELSELYVLAEYSSSASLAEHMERLREIWARLDHFARQRTPAAG